MKEQFFLLFLLNYNNVFKIKQHENHSRSSRKHHSKNTFY